MVQLDESAWKTYLNQGGFFTVLYPPLWQVSDLLNGKAYGVMFRGSEGEVRIYWGGGFGGGPCQSGRLDITTQIGLSNFCDDIVQNGENLSSSNDFVQTGLTPAGGSSLKVTAAINKPLVSNKAVVVSVIKSIKSF